MGESQYLKPFMVRIIIITVAYLLLRGFIGLLAGHTYQGVLEPVGNYEITKVSDLNFQFSEQNVIKLDDAWEEDGQVHYSVSSCNNGKTYMMVYSKSTGDMVSMVRFDVLGLGAIKNMSTNNDSLYRIKEILLFLFLLANTINIWYTFAHVQKLLLYSYQAVFFAGFGVWLGLMTLESLYYYMIDYTMLGLYKAMQNSGYSFMKYSAVFIVIFAVLMTISNISLIKHEGARTTNFLGIGISCAMVWGLIFAKIIHTSISGGSDLTNSINSVLLSTYTSIYCLLECFLIGAIICGIHAAILEPDYDKDYIIILGCKVKSDGTLYPLIKGRVDRAISFYHKQFEKTGKKAVFVPSGGKGTDETLSESEAMKRYLLSQGFGEEQILTENESKNTLQNMKFSKKKIKAVNPKAKIAFSTTNFHVFRSGIIAGQAGLHAQGMGAKTKWYFWPNAYVREMIGMMDFLKADLILILIPMILFFALLEFQY